MKDKIKIIISLYIGLHNRLNITKPVQLIRAEKQKYEPSPIRVLLLLHLGLVQLMNQRCVVEKLSNLFM